MGELKRLETERHDFVKALHNIYNNEHIRPQQAEARKLADFIASAIETDNSLLRNEFGHNRIILALQAICLAEQEIGLRGHSLTAYLLRAVIRKPEQCALVERYFGQDVANTLQGFLRVEAIEVKTEAMRTDNFRNLLISQAGDMRIILMLNTYSVNTKRQKKEVENI